MKTDNSVLPLVALIGPTNAGKSTLFNRLTGSPQSITAREESTTRDRVYGEVGWNGQVFNIVDTGGLVTNFEPTKTQSRAGLTPKANADLYLSIKAQMELAVEEADLVLFIYDGRVGLQPRDQQFMDTFRGKKKIWLVANKVDSTKIETETAQLDYLGLPTYKISAATGRGVGDLLAAISDQLSSLRSEFSTDDSKSAIGNDQKKNNDKPIADGPKPKAGEAIVAIVGRPNVGKSTLLNTLTDSDRAVVSPVAGTTRDVVTADLTINGQKIVLADTAGVRRKGQIEVGIEKFSVKRSLAAISFAQAVMVVVDATEGTTRSDLHLIYFAAELKKPVLVVFNKADLLGDQAVRFHHHIVKFDQIIASAKTGQNLDKIRDWLAVKAK